MQVAAGFKLDAYRLEDRLCDHARLAQLKGAFPRSGAPVLPPFHGVTITRNVTERWQVWA